MTLNPDCFNMVVAQIVRDSSGVCRIFCKRQKYKHWFELGKHNETDMAFEKAYTDGKLRWRPQIVDHTKLF